MAAIAIRPWLPLAVCAAAVAAAAAACACRSAREHPHASVEVSGPSLAIPARIEAKSRVAREVLAGRLSLPEAAAAFKALDAAGPPEARRRSSAGPHDGPDDEALCRTVIAWVQAVAPPEEGDEAACRLEAELDARLRQGTLHLPGP